MLNKLVAKLFYYNEKITYIDSTKNIMINPKELRIDNLIYVNGKTDKHIQKVNVISGGIPIKKAFPIPITEEWLLRFGFEKKGARTFIKYPFKFSLAFELFPMEGVYFSYFVPDSYSGDDDRVERVLKYVHEFQNLHYYLTGKELKIND